MPPSPRQGCSATPSSALPSSSRRYSSRPRRSSTPAPAWCTIHRCPRGQASVCPSPWAPSCVLQSCSAPGRIDTLAGASILSQESGAPRVPARPQVIQEVDEAALTWATRRCWNLLFLRRWREQRHSFPWWRAGRRIFSFCSAAGPRASGTHFLKKEQFPFPPGSQVHGMTVCDALLPHSRPRTFLPVAKRVRFGDDIPPHAPLASPVWDPGSLVGMPQKAPPSVPSTPTPFCCTSTGMSIVLLEPLAQRLEAWLTLPSLSRWLTRTIRLGYAIQFARWPPKFNGVLETLVAVPCLARGDCCPPGKGCNRAGPSSREEAGVLQPLLHRTQETWWPSTNPGSASFEPGFTQAPVQDADVQAHYQMHPAPGLVCSDRPEGCLLSCFDPSVTQTIPTVCIRGLGMAVQGPPLRALPVSPCVHKGRRRRPYPVTGGGCQDPQLPRRLAYPSPIQRAVGGSQGLGAPALQPVGASGQLGKEQALPCAENLFSRCGVRLGEYDGTPHGGTCPSSAELPEFLQRQECGTTETVSEAPGACGIRSCSHATRIASYETTSALATLPGPEVGMAPWYTASGYHPAVLPLPRPLDRPCLSTGRGAPRTSVPAYCCHNRCLQHGLGRYMQRAGSLGALDRARLLWHINCLELWAVHLALRQFRPLLLGKHVLVRTDNTAAVSYIKRLGGIRSHRMSQLARHLLLWSPTQFKSLRAVHIPGKLNRAADALSRQLSFPGEWLLHPETIRLIWSRFGEAQVDLFASPESSHCQLYFSLTEGPLGTDALAHSWPRALRKYAFPPVSLPAQTLCKLREDEEQVLLVVPHWPTRTWFPELISLATTPPWRIPLRKELLPQELGTIWHPCPDLWNRHVWLLDRTRQTWVVYHRQW